MSFHTDAHATVTLPTPTVGPVADIIAATGLHFWIRRRDIVGKERTRGMVRARHIAMYLAKKHTVYSLQRIGRCFNRDHSSVLHAVNKICDEIEAHAADIKAIEIRLGLTREAGE